MAIGTDLYGLNHIDDAYFDNGHEEPRRAFDASLLEQPLSHIPGRPPLAMKATDTVKDAMAIMRRERRGCVLITEDGTVKSRLTGIFTERDVLLKVIDEGQNPADVALESVMTRDPESLTSQGKLAWALNLMSLGGFRHVPVTDANGCPVLILSVRLIVDYLVQSFPQEVLNLPPRFEREKDVPLHGA